MHLLKVNQGPTLMNGKREGMDDNSCNAHVFHYPPTPPKKEEETADESSSRRRRQKQLGIRVVVEDSPTLLSLAYPYLEPQNQALAITEEEDDEASYFYNALTTAPYLAPLDDFCGGYDDDESVGCPLFESLECIAASAAVAAASTPDASITYPQQERETDVEIAPYLQQHQDTPPLTLSLFSDLALVAEQASPSTPTPPSLLTLL